MKRNPAFREAIRAGYALGKTPSEIADEIGSTAGSVKVTALKMGCNRDCRTAAYLRWAKLKAKRHGQTGRASVVKNAMLAAMNASGSDEFDALEIHELTDLTREWGAS